MAGPRTGKFKKGKHKNWWYEVYQDPGSHTGWTRKIWRMQDTSNGGRPTEYFEPYDMEGQLLDESQEAAKQAAKAAKRKAKLENRTAAENSLIRERDYEEDRVYRYKDLDRESAERRLREQLQSGEREGAADRKQRLKEIELRLAEDRRQFDLRHGLDREELGLKRASLGADLLKTGASMRGPLDAFQGFAYAQGVANSDLAPYVRAVYGGSGPAYGGGTATGGSPTPLTVGTLANAMGAGGGGGAGGLDAYGRPRLTGQQEAYLAPIKEAYEGGLANKPLGYLERMSDSQLKAFMSGGAYLGRDVDSEIEYYQRSRPRQGSPLAG